MSSASRPGKTAPRLIRDIIDYDPAHPPETGRNLLAEVPPVYPEHYQGPLQFISPSACSHSYVTKPHQTIRSPQGEHRASSGIVTKISAICSKCRCHLQLEQRMDAGARAGQSFGHIHHFIWYWGKYRGGQREAQVTSKGQVVESFRYECSDPYCRYQITVQVASPLLSDHWVRLLTDTGLLKKRADEALAYDPERLEGMACPQPITVLLNLRAYIDNALYKTQQSKSISAVNKRFMMSFGVNGEPCRDLFEFLGFTFRRDGVWDPPRPSPWALNTDEQRIFLDDVLHELSALIGLRPLVEKKGNQDDYTFPSAVDDFYFAVDAFEYPKAPRLNEFQMAAAPYYEDLGVVEDMSTSSILDAFSRQITVDRERGPRYLQCLKEIGLLRRGEDEEAINRAVETACSEGNLYLDSDITEAYKYFGLGRDDSRLTEDSIIGTFYAYLSSVSSAQETEARRQLWRIGDSRKSERIKSAAEDRIATPEQAQVFLGVSDDTADDFVMTMFTAKVNDNPSCRDVARRAVQLIAEARKSDVLKHFVKTGEMTAGEMDVGDAYLLLQIPDRNADEGAIMAAYTICVDDAPEQAEKYNQALAIIAKEKNSPLLGGMVPGYAAKPDHDLSSWPVGLQNIGNTCYLNSLLQFYFSVSPYREMVLDFEKHKMELDEESCQKKRVGSRGVSKKEIERSQKFLRELGVLFSDMISSPKEFVTPGQELARLTLISPSNEAAIRRRSTISAGQFGGLGELNGMPVLGPLGPPAIIPENETQDQASGPGKTKLSSDEDSEATLVSDGVKNEIPATQADDKENESPQDDTIMIDAPNESTPKTESLNTQAAETPSSDSNKPPPVPPRPTPQVDSRRQLIEEVELGAQQDVTEVINNVLFQSQCAIRPISIAPDGEQLDQVKDLFYGKAISYILSDKGQRSKEEWWCDIKIDVATGPRDIYAAIDGAFDIQKVSVENSVAEQYATISKVPPILQIQVQRVQFDAVKKRSFKSTHHLDLKETIYLDRYMDTPNPELLRRRKQTWEWKDLVRKLEARRAELLRQTEPDGLDTATLLNSARDILNDLSEMKQDPDTAQDAIDVDPALAPELDRLAQAAQNELHDLDQEITKYQTMISSQFDYTKQLPYRLYAVFVHHGSVEFGHYYIYIFDFEREIWRKYNDTYVTEVSDLDEIFKSQDRHNPPTPYFLVYVHDKMKHRLVSPVAREIVETSAESAPGPSASNTAVMEGVAPSKGSEDIEMGPPPYDEVVAESGVSGEGADSEMKERRISMLADHGKTESWAHNGTDKTDVKW
ncbi:hypothetical protein BDW74DRAFT_146881 [Aspergillus multicolor]|uniref:ubiquitin-specific protease UBP2 n=1 Tax=Aspergillus multicolor TaxID=41759 RepID=UPI003CCE517C